MRERVELSPLEAALAMNAGIRVLSNPHYALPQTIAGVGADNAEECHQLALEEYLKTLHQTVFWEHHHPESHVDQLEREPFRSILGPLIEQCYDREGRLEALEEQVSHQTRPSLLAMTYDRFLKEQPFDFGNREIAAIFLIQVARAVTGRDQALDFSRITDPMEKAMLAHPGQFDLQQLAGVFSTALRAPERVEAKERPDWQALPKEWRHISDGTFQFSLRDSATYHVVTSEGQQPFIMMEDRGLVPLADVQAHYNTHGVVDDFSIARADIERYPHESWRSRTMVDGIPFGDRVRPLRTDIDHVTGLTRPELKQLEQVAVRAREAGIPVKYHTDIPEHIDVLRMQDYHAEEQAVLEKAMERLQHTAPMMKQKVQEHIAATTEVEHPAYYVTIGGSGAGKGALLEYAQQRTGNNAVVASLDDARTYFDVWSYGVSHGHDYPHLANGAGIMRNMLMDAAVAHNRHLIRDCSGVPYAREKALLDQQKAQGREVTVLGVTADTEKALVRSYHRLYDADDQVKMGGRGLDASILVGKHTQVSREFGHFLQDRQIDKVILFDNNGQPGETFTLGKLHHVSMEQYARLEEARKADTLLDALQTEGMLPHHPPKAGVNPRNVDYFLQSTQGGQARVFVVYDTERYFNFLMKGLQNAKAVAPDELWKSNVPHMIPSGSSYDPLPRLQTGQDKVGSASFVGRLEDQRAEAARAAIEASYLSTV